MFILYGDIDERFGLVILSDLLLVLLLNLRKNSHFNIGFILDFFMYFTVASVLIDMSVCMITFNVLYNDNKKF